MGISFLLFGVFVASVSVVIWLFRDNPLLSPITSSTTLQFLSDKLTNTNKDNSPKMIYGFLPYWNVNQVTIQPELTQLAYFSLTFDHTGHIVSRSGGEVDQGYHKLQSEDFVNVMQVAQKNHAKMEIVLAQFDNDEISSFLLSPNSQQQLLTELNSILLEYPFTGVNIDIEYTGPITQNLQDDFTTFIHNLRVNLQQRRQPIMLSIDIFASAGDNSGIWNLPKLAPELDELVVMAYDFHRRSSP